jgi:hypothetical protein
MVAREHPTFLACVGKSSQTEIASEQILPGSTYTDVAMMMPLHRRKESMAAMKCSDVSSSLFLALAWP